MRTKFNIFKKISLIIALTLTAQMLFSTPKPAQSQSTIGLTATSTLIEIQNNDTKVQFSRPDTNSPFVISVYTYNDGDWEAFLNGQRPLVEGSHFGNNPTSYSVVTDNASEKAIRLSGYNSTYDYDWNVLVETNVDTSLIQFSITHEITAEMTSVTPPYVTFGIDGDTAPDVIVEQGPMSIYGNGNYGYDFPTGYVWKDSKAAMLFYDWTNTTWLENYSRGLNYRVSYYDFNPGYETGTIGLQPKATASNATIGVGNVVTVFYLFTEGDVAEPDKLDALSQMIDTFAPLMPADADIPTTKISPYTTDWETYAENGLLELLDDDGFNNDDTLYINTPVGIPDADMHMGLVESIEEIATHPDRPPNSFYDFSTVNNHLAPWILFDRLNPAANSDIHTYGMMKIDGLPSFYDDENQIISWSPGFGEFQMSWQNFWYYAEMPRINDTLDAEDYNPAILGRFLMGLSGLEELADNVDYNFPQWWYTSTRQAAGQQDVPALGDIREPWQAGTYAYIMLEAYRITNDSNYLTEAQNAISKILTDLSYSVNNQVYNITYSDPADFPVTEIFGNGYGAIAAYQIYELTSNADYLTYSDYFLTTLLVRAYWYEDNFSTVGQALDNIGLFHPTGGSANTTPWETNEAAMYMTWLLQNNDQLTAPRRLLMLKLLNLIRVNSFDFFPASFDTVVANHAGSSTMDLPNLYQPIEPFFSLEGGGHTGGGACYKPSAYWFYWMYEALAEPSNSDILVTNTAVLDNFEESLSSTERHFLVFNPTDSSVTFNFISKQLADSNYSLTITYDDSSSSTNNYTKAQLESGISITLNSLASAEVDLTHSNVTTMQASIDAVRDAQNELANAYRQLQEFARDDGMCSDLITQKNNYLTALSNYESGNYSTAETYASNIITALSTLSCPTASPTNYALAATATADSAYFSASQAIDNQWSTQANDAWVSTGSTSQHRITLDLGSLKTLNKFVVKHVGYGASDDPDYNTRDFTIQGSTDNINWTNLVEVNDNTANETTHEIDPGIFRYVRLVITDPGPDNYARIYEFETWGDSNAQDSNLASSATITADSVTYAADNAADAAWTDQVTDAWVSTSATTEHWLQYDLGQQRVIDQFVVKHVGYGPTDNPDYNTVVFSLQGSNDGSSWATLKSYSNNTSSLTLAQTGGVAFRYIRLYISDPGPDDYARIFELEVWGR